MSSELKQTSAGNVLLIVLVFVAILGVTISTGMLLHQQNARETERKEMFQAKESLRNLLANYLEGRMIEGISMSTVGQALNMSAQCTDATKCPGNAMLAQCITENGTCPVATQAVSAYSPVYPAANAHGFTLVPSGGTNPSEQDIIARGDGGVCYNRKLTVCPCSSTDKYCCLRARTWFSVQCTTASSPCPYADIGNIYLGYDIQLINQ